MSATLRNLREDITYWVATPSTYGGFVFSTPTTLKGRWEEKAMLFRDSTGDEVTSEAVVYLDTDVNVGDFLFHGSSAAADPTTVQGTKQIRQFSKIPDLRHVDYERKAFL